MNVLCCENSATALYKVGAIRIVSRVSPPLFYLFVFKLFILLSKKNGVATCSVAAVFVRRSETTPLLYSIEGQLRTSLSDRTPEGDI